MGADDNGGRMAGVSLRLDFDNGERIGPGKADLLEAIRETGSIAAAGRRLGMSYRRAWTLVERLNATFRNPLVASSRGGAAKGGARLTDSGERALALYRRVEAQAVAAAADELEELRSLTSARRERAAGAPQDDPSGGT